jgi:hypothetical protein
MPLIRNDLGAIPRADARDSAAPATLLRDGAADERWDAARRLADDPAGLEPLAAALALEREPRVREAILTGLVRQGGDPAVRALLAHIRSEDAGLRTGVLDALRALPEALAPRMSEVLADPDPDVRLLSCDLARALDPAQASTLLCELLERDQEVNVCAAAVDALAEVGGPEAVPALLRCAGRFPNEPFLGFAIKVAVERIGSGSSA